MSDLLKESIADAKAVRETALANAKTFLEENFAASMKEMFASKLKEEMAEEAPAEGEEGKIEEKLASSGIGGEKGNVASKQHAKNPSPSANKTSTETSGKGPEVVKLEEEEANDEDSEKSVDEGAEVTSEELDEILAELEKENDDKEEVNEEESEEKEVDEAVNLDELLAELEAEENAPVPTPAPEMAAPAPTPAPTPAPAPAPEMTAAPAQVPSPAEEVMDSEESVTPTEMAEALVAINEENESLKSQLSEYEKTVKYLKGVLNETNLLNAKLLYTNKLFKGKNLTEEQKLKVINTFDLTKNIREVKLAYTVLAESINSGASVAKKKTNATAQTITEGLASKPVSSTKPEAAIVAPEASELASRLQKLAGITK